MLCNPALFFITNVNTKHCQHAAYILQCFVHISIIKLLYFFTCLVHAASDPMHKANVC